MKTLKVKLLIYNFLKTNKFVRIREWKFIIIIIIITYLLTYLVIYLLTAIEFSLGGSSPYNSTDKKIRINIHKRKNKKHSKNNTKHSKYKYITKTPPHTHTHTLQNKLKQPQYKIHTKRNSHNTYKYPLYNVTLMSMVLFSLRASP